MGSVTGPSAQAREGGGHAREERKLLAYIIFSKPAKRATLLSNTETPKYTLSDPQMLQPV